MLNFAINIARDAGRILAERYGRSNQIIHKGDINIVTEADLAAESFIIEQIGIHYPRHAVLAEESGASVQRPGERSEWRWIIDPLDGTTNYSHGYPCFCVSIALEHTGETVVGVIYDPLRDELFAAERGRGATLNERRIHVSQVDDLNQALLCTGFPYDVRERGDFAHHFVNFTMRAQAVRRDGSAALDLAYVACGRFDGFWEDYCKPFLASSSPPADTADASVHSESGAFDDLSGLKPWDAAAGVLLIEEAGGRVSKTDGSPFKTAASDTILVVSNRLLHDEMVLVLAL